MRIRKRFEQLKEAIERANPLSRKERREEYERVRQEEQEQIDTSQQEGETLSEERSDNHFGGGEDLEIGEERRIWSDEGELEIGEERRIRNDSAEELSDDLEKGRNEWNRNSDR